MENDENKGKMIDPSCWGTRRTVLEVTEEWEACIGGGVYTVAKNETSTDWKVTADMFPKSLGDDPRLAGLVGITIEGPCRNVLPLLKHMVEVIEMMDADFKERGDVSDDPLMPDPDHKLWVRPFDFNKLARGERVQVPYRHSTKRPEVGDTVEVRTNGRVDFPMDPVVASVLEVDSDDEVTTTIRRTD